MKKPTQQLPRGTYQVTVIHEDCVRVDLLDSCIPAIKGEIEDGWGCAFLSTSQLFELSKELTSAAIRAQPASKAPQKLGRPKK